MAPLCHERVRSLAPYHAVALIMQVAECWAIETFTTSRLPLRPYIALLESSLPNSIHGKPSSVRPALGQTDALMRKYSFASAESALSFGSPMIIGLPSHIYHSSESRGYWRLSA